MKQISLLILSALTATAHATYMFNNIDISPMIDHFKKQVVTLDKSVTTYSWAPRDDFWNKERPQDDPALLSMAQDLAGSFWRGYGSKEGADNMYGYGLYMAVDPVSTVDYGTQNWRLTQVEFPAGTRMLDFVNGETIKTTDTAAAQAAQDVEEKFGCPRSAAAEPYFTNGGVKLAPQCRKLIYEVFNNALQIDAFAYGYMQTNFKACANGIYLGPRAFVVTRPDWMRSKYVHFYTADSRLNEEERVRIETLFLLAVSENLDSKPLLSLIAQYFDQHADRELQSSRTVCEGDSCTITVKFCDAKNTCEEVALPPLPRPGGPTITVEEASKTKLLWTDLVGKPKSTTITTWLKENKFGCSGELPYQVK